MLTQSDLVSLACRLGAAVVIGLALGLEREWRGHEAGMRTHAIVALSSATITLSALLLFDDLRARGGNADPLRVVQGLAQAIGFIAGGLIFVRGGDVRNMTTAVSLWMAAAGGIAAGAGQWMLLAMAGASAIVILCLDYVIPKRTPGSNGETEDTRMPNRRGNTPRSD